MPKDLGRERDAFEYADFTIRELPWWKRLLRRFERVFMLNR